MNFENLKFVSWEFYVLLFYAHFMIWNSFSKIAKLKPTMTCFMNLVELWIQHANSQQTAESEC